MSKKNEIRLSDNSRQPCEIWTRVMGYFRPVSAFNIGKKSEYAERVCFKESVAVEKMEEKLKNFTANSYEKANTNE